MKEMIGPNRGVTILGRSGLRYREGSKSLFVDGEIRTGSADFAIFEKSISSWEGSNEVIAGSERTQIIANIVGAFAQNGARVAVE
jgi:Immunity protein 74